MSLTAEDIRNCTMIAMDQPPWWPVKEEENEFFKFTIRTSGPAAPFLYTGPRVKMYEAQVDWGDGESSYYESLVNTNLSHVYSEHGEYQISIRVKKEYNKFTEFSQVGVSYGGIISIDTPIPFSACSAEDIQDGILVYYKNHFSFSGTQITTIPDDLFSKVKNIWKTPIVVNGEESEPYSGTLPDDYGDAVSQFRECRMLVEVPDKLYENSGSRSFRACFYGCVNLTTLHSDIFKNSEKAESFQDCFLSCRSLTSIPSDLFKYVPSATIFLDCFQDCRELESIPSRLFAELPEAIDFRYCFYGCTSITELPGTIFGIKTKDVSFERTFQGCTGLTSIPANLFSLVVSPYSFIACFSGCARIRSAVPELWNYYPDLPRSHDCFYRCIRAANYSDIPEEWR